MTSRKYYYGTTRSTVRKGRVARSSTATTTPKRPLSGKRRSIVATGVSSTNTSTNSSTVTTPRSGSGTSSKASRSSTSTRRRHHTGSTASLHKRSRHSRPSQSHTSLHLGTGSRSGSSTNSSTSNTSSKSKSKQSSVRSTGYASRVSTVRKPRIGTSSAPLSKRKRNGFVPNVTTTNVSGTKRKRYNGGSERPIKVLPTGTATLVKPKTAALQPLIPQSLLAASNTDQTRFLDEIMQSLSSSPTKHNKPKAQPLSTTGTTYSHSRNHSHIRENDHSWTSNKEMQDTVQKSVHVHMPCHDNAGKGTSKVIHRSLKKSTHSASHSHPTTQRKTAQVQSQTQHKSQQQHSSVVIAKTEKKASNAAAPHSRRESQSRDKRRPMTGTSSGRSSARKKLTSVTSQLESKTNSAVIQSKSGLTISDLKIKSLLGEGAFSKVYLAKWDQCSVTVLSAVPKDLIHSHVAVKVMRRRDIQQSRKRKTANDRDIKALINERYILSKLRHPFIVSYYGSLMDDRRVYILTEYAIGGEILFHFESAKNGRFDSATVQFYSAELVCALSYLHHTCGYVYRDLKPENVLLDCDGHLKLVDFGFAKQIQGSATATATASHKTYTLCGSKEYVAPEVLMGNGHSYAVDYWSLGVLMYELIVGHLPFPTQDASPLQVLGIIKHSRLAFPRFVGDRAQDLIRKLLVIDPSKRLGHVKRGHTDWTLVQRHPFFAGFDWHKCDKRELTPPIRPEYKSADDASNYATAKFGDGEQDSFDEFIASEF